jgi:hypothetical protein
MTRKTVYRKAVSDYYGPNPPDGSWRKVYNVLSLLEV